MSWLPDYAQRIAVTVETSGSAGTTKDVTFQVAADFADFWETIQSTGYDMRVTSSDGLTPVLYDQASYDYALRTLTVELDNVTVTSVTQTLFWL